MVYVRIEMWPAGDRTKSRLLQELTIVNDGTAKSMRVGNYDATLSYSRSYSTTYNTTLRTGFADPNQPHPKEVWRRGRVERFPHIAFSPAELLLRALANVFGHTLPTGRR